jgi:hypothetical protein
MSEMIVQNYQCRQSKRGTQQIKSEEFSLFKTHSSKCYIESRNYPYYVKIREETSTTRLHNCGLLHDSFSSPPLCPGFTIALIFFFLLRIPFPRMVVKMEICQNS